MSERNEIGDEGSRKMMKDPSAPRYSSMDDLKTALEV